MRRKTSLLISLVLCLGMILSSISVVDAGTFYYPKQLTMHSGYTVNLLKGNKGKVKWKSSNKKIVTVSSKGVVVAKKTGKATITATKGKKKYKTKVTVQAKEPYVVKITGEKNTVANVFSKEYWEDWTFHQAIPVDIYLKNVKHDIEGISLSFSLASDWPESNYSMSYNARPKSEADEDDDYFEKIDDSHYRVYLKRSWSRPIPSEKYILGAISIYDIYGGFTHINTKLRYYASEYFKMKNDIGITYKN